ncbi:hypothetical protein [Pseudanabaena mucicola]|uniref:Uncharacterized protein n=1 Tax=Pseudanabaena mucicola FACHB-723 TaxID=2692860 RepID=A0ABR7ZS38_9CYAN|nr:hypothetical protein [Pseudanabaena mucicola]MBD2186584.1 hypothetical protein [Pseudanabaena mucicola FACHB-723]
MVTAIKQVGTVGKDVKSAWDVAMSEISGGSLEMKSLRRERINQLFATWAMLDSEDEQKEVLKIIESVEGVSILQSCKL